MIFLKILFIFILEIIDLEIEKSEWAQNRKSPIEKLWDKLNE